MISKRIKWNNNGIQYRRGDYEVLIARYNNHGPWFTLRAMATQQTQKSRFRDLAEYFDDEVTEIEVKRLYGDDGSKTENAAVFFAFHYDGSCHFS